MDRERWARVEELLQQALDLEGEAREEFLRGLPDEDRRDVEALLSGEGPLVTERPAVAWVAEEIAAPALQPGQRLGRYRVVRRIGAGGMGEVYEAHDDTLQRTVAIKVLPAELGADVARFEREALAVSRFTHQNIITIYEIVHLDGVHFIVTELVEGQTLRSLLTDTATGEPRALEPRQALDVAVQVAMALHAAHGKAIVHRDIKPENLMVRTDGLVKVLDFGIAKVGDDPAPGAVVGTASYMSPEQLRGEALDGCTDLFSLGVVLYEMLSGERPFTGATRAVTTTLHLDRALPSTNRLGRLPTELQRIVRKLLEPERELRYASAAALLDDLRALQHHIEGRRARTIRRAFLGTVLLLVVVGVAGTWLTFTETWHERVLRDGHTAAVEHVVLSPDGRLLVSCGEDGQVIVWDFARRQRLKTLSVVAYKLAYAPDGRWFATGGQDGAVRIWDARHWTEIAVLRGLRTSVRALTASPDGTLLVAASDERTILWRVRGWQQLHAWEVGTVYSSFVFSPDHRQLLAGNSFQHYYDIPRGLRLRTNLPDIGANWVVPAPDGEHFAGLDANGGLSVLRLAQGRSLHRLERVAYEDAHHDNGRSVAFSPDGRLIATAAEDVVLWNALTLEKIARFEYASVVWCVVFSPDGRWLVSSHADGAVLVWDVAQRARVASFNEHSGAVRAVAFSHDGRTLASASDDQSVALWDVRLGRRKAVLRGHDTRVMSVALPRGTPDPLVSGDFNGQVFVWHGERPRVKIATIVAFGLAISPDGRRVVTTHGVYDTLDGRQRIAFEPVMNALARRYGHPFVYGVAYSADGRRLAAVTEGGVVTVWDARTLRLLGAQQIHDTSQIAVSLSSDGERMVTGEDEGAVRLWSVTPLRQIAILGRHAARVKSVAFAPDGKTAASAGDDKMIALWDLRRRTLRTRIGTHTTPVYAVTFSPDGRQLASGEHDRSVRVYTRRLTVWGVEWD